MDNLTSTLMATALALMPSDDIRHPIVVDHNDTIWPLVVAIVECIRLYGLIKAAPAVRVAAESLFVIGYRQALKDAKNQPDESIWDF